MSFLAGQILSMILLVSHFKVAEMKRNLPRSQSNESNPARFCLLGIAGKLREFVRFAAGKCESEERVRFGDRQSNHVQS